MDIESVKTLVHASVARGVAGNLFLGRDNGSVISGVQAQSPRWYLGKSPPPQTRKYAENVIECHKFHVVQTKDFSAWQFRRGTCPLSPLPYTPVCRIDGRILWRVVVSERHARYINKSVCRRNSADYYQSITSLPWLLLNYRLSGLLCLTYNVDLSFWQSLSHFSTNLI